jgi:hypothetical protein
MYDGTSRYGFALYMDTENKLSLCSVNLEILKIVCTHIIDPVVAQLSIERFSIIIVLSTVMFKDMSSYHDIVNNINNTLNGVCGYEH